MSPMKVLILLLFISVVLNLLALQFHTDYLFGCSLVVLTAARLYSRQMRRIDGQDKQ